MIGKEETDAEIDAQIADDIRAVLAVERGAYGACPLYGRACVGPMNCAPAKFHADFLHAMAVASSNDPALEVRPSDVCPITRVVDGISVAAQALLPLLLGPMEPTEETPAPVIPDNETPSERIIRERNSEKLRILGKMPIDQRADV